MAKHWGNTGRNIHMSDQQPADDRNQQDPYPADQQFGTAAAEDQERVVAALRDAVA